MNFVGRSGSTVLFSSGELAVIVDETTKTVLETGISNALVASASWDASGKAPESAIFEIANAAVTDLDIHVFADNDRMYTIPKAVVSEAKRGLEWRKEHNRGGTSVGVNTARTLARGGQIGIKKVRHIAKYFPRHEVDKKGQGYKPGDDGYPSKGRIAWALWGGDAAWRWASAIVEREDAKSAANFDMYEAISPLELDAFVASAVDSNEFYIRLFADGSGFDRLYKKDEDGVLSVWEKGSWYDLGESFSEFVDMDKELDEFSPASSYFYAPVEPDAALVASAFLDNSVSGFAKVESFDDEEVALAYDALSEIDWQEIDAVTAAGAEELIKGYTPEERAANAKKQVRDATGKFAKNGSRVSVSSTGREGTITGLNPDRGSVNVTYDDGTSGEIPANETAPVVIPAQSQGAESSGTPPKMFTGGPIDVSGILAEPRDVFAKPGATLPAGTLPPLTSQDINTLLTDWPSWVQAQRDAFVPMDIPQIPITPDSEQFKAPNAFNDPYLRKWLDKRVKNADGSYSYPNRFWYQPTPGGDVEAKKSAKEVGTVKMPDYSKPGKGSTTTRTWSWQYFWKNGKKYKRKKWSTVTAAAGAKEVGLTPATSDVPPVFMAVVSPDDPLAVMDLISLIPATNQSTKPVVYSFANGKWSLDDGMLRDLKSPTPPPVVVLDDEALKSVLSQMSSGSEDKGKEESAPVTASVDEYLAFYWSEESGMLAVTAAGGLDRNRGNAEKLRRYWTIGKGGLKIRWGTGGDWTRCVRHLSKYLGPRAKGYCALRHKEMTGLWTGDKAHRQMYGRRGKGVFAMSDEMILAESEIIDSASMRARVSELRARVMTASGGFQAPAESEFGAEFSIPLVVPEGIETGDGRRFSKGAITMRELPLPLMWQIKTDEGHYGSVVVGRIDHMERIDGGIGNARGIFDTGEYGREAERLVRNGFIRGISADLDKFEADDDPEDAANKEKKGHGKVIISKARVMGITLVPKPAFQECTIHLIEEQDNMDAKEQDALIACASVVASIPVVPPRDWFKDPKLAGPTPLTVTDDGRVFGHIAAWHVDHIGLSFGTKPPRSRSGYAYFHTGVVRTDDGADVPVGQLTLTGGHASLSADARSAAKHYDDTGSAFADVHAGEDAYGIWVAGSLRPEVSAQQVRAIRASAPSGDWRPIQGNLELVAVCQVNVPGFPIARARVASGQMYALVAAGASYLAQLKENPDLVLQAAEDAKARFSYLKQEMGLVAGGGCGCCELCNSACTGNCCGSCVMANSSVEPVYMGSLKQLLADLVGFYFRAHGYHWNVVGEDFAQYHELFGEIYEDVYGSIDPLAENVRKLGGFPPVSLKEFAEESSLAGTELVGGSPKALAADLLLANEALVEELKGAFSMMDAANEQGVADFIAGRIDAHQKWSWQLASSLTPDDIIIVENQEKDSIFEAVFATLSEQGLIASAGEDFAYIPQSVREKAAEKGQALPDGSFPIRNINDLKNAVRAYGRAKASKRAAVRKHIIKRAKQLKRPDLIPDTFKDTAAIEAAEFSAVKEELATRVRGYSWADKASELSARVHGLTAAGEPAVEDVALIDEVEKADSGYQAKYTPKTQPRDAQGRFRQVLARLKQDLGAASLDRVAQKVEEVENLDNTGNYAAAAAGARDVIDVVNRIDTKALDPESLSSVRMGASALAEAISNLPLPFKNQSQKIRYSDVPPALRDLMDDMITKVEAKIGADDAKIATEKLEDFRSGSEVFSQSEISSEMNKLLRLLT